MTRREQQQQQQQQQQRLQRRIRALLLTFMVGLVVSGLTAFPLETELRWLTGVMGAGAPASVSGWLVTVRDALVATNARYPFLAYGTDWLAFAHLVIAVAFVGPLRDPVRNVWVVTFGLIACAAVVPLALVAGAVRGIPLYWRLIDCSFGVFGAALLWPCRRAILELEGLLAASGDSESARTTTPPRTARTVALAALAVAALSGSTTLGCAPGGVMVGAGGAGVSNVRTGPGRKKVVARRPPSLLLAADGSGCDVSPDRFKGTAVGDVVDCPDWRADPSPR